MNTSHNPAPTPRDDREEAEPTTARQSSRQPADRNARRFRTEIDQRIAGQEHASVGEEPICKSLIEHSQDIFFVADTNGNVTHIFGNTMGIVGYTPEELLQMTAEQKWSVCHPEDAPALRQWLAKQLQEQTRGDRRVRLQDKAGEYRWIELSLIPRYDDRATWVGFQGTLHDISDRVQAEQIVRSLSTTAQTALQVATSPDSVFQVVTEQLADLGLVAWILLLDPSEKQVRLMYRTAKHQAISQIADLLNPPISLDDLPGYADVVRQKRPIWSSGGVTFVSSLLPPSTRELAAQLTESFQAFGVIVAPLLYNERTFGLLSVAGNRLDRTLLPAVSAFANQIAIAIRNAQLVSQLQEREELYALGKMAAGIAHDFNKILTGVLGYADMALLSLREGNYKQAVNDLRQLRASAKAGAEIVRAIQSLQSHASHPDNLAPVQFDALAEEALALTRPMWQTQPSSQAAGIHVQREFTAPPPVYGNAVELRRVLINLLMNAIEAMPQGGTLSITTGFHAGRSFISVRDSGMGMTKEQCERVFEPFFTTKPSKGSGLGLAVSRDIIERHHGHITVDSTPGQGSIFTIYLPAPEDPSNAQPAQPVERSEDRPLHILVVDDDPHVAALVKRLLEQHGHIVTVTNADLDSCAVAASQPIDLLITDLAPTNLSGETLFKQIKEMSRDIPVIIITGHPELDTERLPELGIRALLLKPFQHDDLLQAIQKLRPNH